MAWHPVRQRLRARLSAAVAVAALASLPAMRSPAAAERTQRHGVVAAGIAVDVPAGMTAKVEAAAAPASGQWLAQATLSVAGSELVRVEVYANPRAQSAGGWVAAAWQELARQTLLRPVEAGVPRWKGLRGDVAASPQSHARTVVFIAAGERLVHVACAVPNAVAQGHCNAVVAGLAKAGAP